MKTESLDLKELAEIRMRNLRAYQRAEDRCVWIALSLFLLAVIVHVVLSVYPLGSWTIHTSSSPSSSPSWFWTPRAANEGGDR